MLEGKQKSGKLPVYSPYIVYQIYDLQNPHKQQTEGCNNKVPFKDGQGNKQGIQGNQQYLYKKNNIESVLARIF